MFRTSLRRRVSAARCCGRAGGERRRLSARGARRPPHCVIVRFSERTRHFNSTSNSLNDLFLYLLNRCNTRHCKILWSFISSPTTTPVGKLLAAPWSFEGTEETSIDRRFFQNFENGRWINGSSRSSAYLFTVRGHHRKHYWCEVVSGAIIVLQWS